MRSEHRGAAGLYQVRLCIRYDNSPVLHATKGNLPPLHPYGTVKAGGRYGHTRRGG
ncbi:DUF6420 family protein [Streptomyces sp. NPDC051132]|uniref:DUF6420 family protein n=1 Tax=unclassified Streptomyces TaxID=2593676 RepID=UPI003420A9D5